MGISPPSARLGVRSHSAALPALPIISTAVAYTRANRTVRSDSATVRRECRLRRRVKVRCGMPRVSESAAFLRSSFSPSTMREPDGRPLRIRSASSAKLLMERPRTFLPPRASAIPVDVILALWLFIVRQLASGNNPRLGSLADGVRMRFLLRGFQMVRVFYFPDSVEFYEVGLDRNVGEVRGQQFSGAEEF